MAASRPIDVSEFIDRARLSPFQIVTMVICGLVAMLDGFDAQSIGYVVPVIAKAWGIQGAAVGASFKWVGSAGLFGLMIGALVGGPVADALGRKRVMLFSTAVFGVLTLLTAAAYDVPSLIVLRFLTGLGLGGAMPNTIALTAEYAPHRIRATLISVMFVGFPVGNVLAGALSVPLIDVLGWQGVFYFGGGAPLLLLPFAIALMPESVRFLVARQKDGGRVAAILSRIDAGASFRAADHFMLPEKQLKGFTVKHLFREGRAAGTILLWIAFFMNLLIIFLFTFWLPQMLNQQGVKVEHAIWITALFNGGGSLGGLAIGWLTDRDEPFKLIIGAFAGAAISIVAVAFAGTSVPLLVLTVLLTGITVVGGQFGINALAARVYPTHVRSTGVSWGLGIGRIGSIVGPLLGGVMLQFQWRPTEIFLTVAVPALIATVAMIFMSRTQLARHGRDAR